MPKSQHSSTGSERDSFGSSSQSGGSGFYPSHTGVKNAGLSMVSGMAFGGGPEVAHSLVQSLTGEKGHSFSENQIRSKAPFEEERSPYLENNPCFEPMNKFSNCLREHQSEIKLCQIHYDNFLGCRGANNV